MRRLVFLLGVIVLVVPVFGVHAQMGGQAEPADWDLSQELMFEEVGYMVNIPGDWVADTDGAGTYYLATTAADINVLADGDNATAPKGDFAAQFVFLPREMMAELAGVETSNNLDLLDVIIEATGLTLSEDVVEFGVSTYRAVTAIGGPFHGGRDGAGTLIQHDGYVLVASFSGATTEVFNANAFNWGRLLGSYRPIEASSLATHETSPVGFNFNYPEGWQTVDVDDRTGIYQLEADYITETQATGDPIQGDLMLAVEYPLNAGDIDETADVYAQLPGAILPRFGLDPNTGDFVVTEHIILEQPAVTIESIATTGLSIYLTGFVLDGELKVIALGSPTSLEPYRTIWNDVLFSISTE